MKQKENLELIKRNTEEVISEHALSSLLKKKKSPVAYCGYEISGPVHLGHLVTITKLLDLQEAGFKIKILLADVHTLLNKKNPEVKKWENSLKATGIKAEFVLGSSFQFKEKYQFDVMSLAQEITISRGVKSMQMLARNIENATISQIWYPLMQIADIKHLKADVALGGIDQRKIHVLGKDMSKKLNHDFIAVHTPLITSLKGPGQKMSSSIPGSLVSITNSDTEIKNIISKSYCPQGEIKDNPLLQIARLIIFPKFKKLEIYRQEKFGGNVVYMSYEELENDFTNEKLHPADLKQSVAFYLEEIIAPIRESFKS
ncbi:tyrosine--tRNA ligase [Candidatus Pacearchaeota archaeon]|nr:tyrosine--tRNA ligase [Candidatus Pacearchaeota archaeon]